MRSSTLRHDLSALASVRSRGNITHRSRFWPNLDLENARPKRPSIFATWAAATATAILAPAPPAVEYYKYRGSY